MLRHTICTHQISTRYTTKYNQPHHATETSIATYIGKLFLSFMLCTRFDDDESHNNTNIDLTGIKLEDDDQGQ